jgi:L-fucose isomerase-like protein
MKKIAFVRTSHKDYLGGVPETLITKALGIIKNEGTEIFYDPNPLTDPVKARNMGCKICSENVDGVIIFFDSWSDPSVAMALILEIKHIPIVLWGFPMFEHKGSLESTGSFVGLTVFKAALKRLGIRHKYIYGLPGDEGVIKNLQSFVNVASSIRSLRASRMGFVGYSAMSIYSGTFDHLLLRGLIGPEVVQIDTYSLLRIADSANKKQYRQFLDNVKKFAKIAEDVKEEYIEKEGRIYFATKELIKNYDLNAINIKCQYELSQEYGCIPCPALSLIAEEKIVAGCEGDCLTTISQLILHHITGQIITYGDILNMQNGELIFSSCGFAPYSLAHNPDKVNIRDIGHPGFEGPIVSLTLKEEKITFMRLGEKRGEFVMSMGTGEGMESELRQGRFPALKFKLDGSQDKFLDSMTAQHFAICYGDHTNDLIDLCNFLGIEYFLVN